MIRITIMLDLLSDEPAEAYGMLRKIMREVEDAHIPPGCMDGDGTLEGWMTTGDWFDDDGDPMPEEDIAEARTRFYEDHLDLDKEQL